MQFLAVNWLAVAIAAVANMVVGFLWYGLLFARWYLQLKGWRSVIIKPSPAAYPIGLAIGFITSGVLSVIVLTADVATWWGGALIGAGLWIAFGALPAAYSVLFEYRPAGLWLLFSAYQFVVLAAAGAMFAMWR